MSGARVTAAQSVDEIVEKHLAAAGGRAALAQITSRISTGTITLTTPAGDLAGAIEIVSATPGRERARIDLDLSAMGLGKMTVVRRFDGQTGSESNSLQGNRTMEGIELESMRNEANAFPNALLAYKQGGPAIALNGKEKVGERDAYVLISTPKSGPPTRVYLDAESFLPIKAVATTASPDAGQFEGTTELLDYRDVDGVKVPFQIKFTSPATGFTIAFTSVAHNVTTDPSIFATPAN
jgi:hypothetical protein